MPLYRYVGATPVLIPGHGTIPTGGQVFLSDEHPLLASAPTAFEIIAADMNPANVSAIAAAAAAVAGLASSPFALARPRNKATAGSRLVAYGDSITAGNGASDAAHCYVNLLAGKLGRSVLVNNGYGGDQALDIFARNYEYTPSAAQNDLVSLLVGTNDASVFGVGYEEQAKRAIQALAVWFQRGTEIIDQTDLTYSPAGWEIASPYGGLKKATTAGAWFEYQPVGKTLYIGAVQFFNLPMDVVVSSGGVTLWSGTVTIATKDAATQNGTSYSLAMIRIPLSAVPDEPVRVTINTANILHLKFAGSSPASTASRQLVAIGAIPPSSTFGAVYGAYADVIRDAVFELQQDGQNVRVFDVQGALGDAMFADAVHPNDAGHAAIADVAYRSITAP